MSKRSYNKKPESPASSQVRQTIVGVAHNLGQLSPSYLTCDRNFKVQAAPAISTLDATSIGPDEYPFGARVILLPGTPTAWRYQQLIRTSCSLKLEAVDFLPKLDADDDRENVLTLRRWAAARYCFMFDAANPPALKGKIVQVEEMAQICRDILGFDFEMLMEALIWAWRNAVPGGRSGKCAFRLVWERDLLGFKTRHRSRDFNLPPLLRRYAADLQLRKAPYEVVAHLIGNALELERTFEWIQGYRKRSSSGWAKSAMKSAEVSPLAILWAIYRPSDVVQGDLNDHAKKNLSILTRLQLSEQAQRAALPYELCLGYDELGFIIHIMFWMWKETLKPTANLNREDASKIFRFACNMLAWIDPGTAAMKLALRFRGESHAELRNEIVRNGPPSLFDTEAEGSKWGELVANDGLTMLGADLVLRQEGQELDRASRGLRDRSKNPLIRAGYCPEAWIRDMGNDTMLDAWICSREALQRLDVHYASSRLKKKELKQAMRLAIMISETPTAPMTDFLFGHRLQLPSLFFGRFIRQNESAKNFHFGIKTQIAGLPKSRISLNSNVFGARGHYDAQRNHWRK